jgi:Domain of unknown function (DUF6431)
VLAPLTIVWACELNVESYAKLGREVEVPRPSCPDCGGAMTWWSWYQRDVREGGLAGIVNRLWVRRAMCRRCEITHALLPVFALVRRLDIAATIGTAVALAVAGKGMGKVGRELGRPRATVRSWRKRHRLRAAVLYAEFAALAVSLGAGAANYSAVLEVAALEALAVAFEQAQRRPGQVFGGAFSFASAVTGGAWLANNTTSPLCSVPGVRLPAQAPSQPPLEDAHGP